jgi:glucose/arabinose dehydrogenase
MRCTLVLTLVLSAFALICSQGILSAQVTYTPAITGLSSPVAITNAGDGTGRLFITEQPGKIQVWNGSQIHTFLDIITLTDFDNGERGLLSVAFSPDYTNNGTFWIYYTDTNGDVTVARYKVSGGDPDTADPNSGQVILTIPHPGHANHNGGQLQFGNDGFLYMGTGDGGGGGDPNGNGQNTNVLLGKILRIDPVLDGGPPYYNVPASNPFVGVVGTKPEIWAYGVRNPWRFSFDRQNHDLWIGDVGQNCWEELDHQSTNSTGGENYGWNIKEGRHCYKPSDGCNPAPGACNFGVDTANPAVFEYSHSGNPNPNACNAITGGYMYRGSMIPSLIGTYLYAEYCGGTVWNLTFDGGSGTWQSATLFDTDFLISSFGEDESGEIYFADLGGGTVYKLVQLPTLPFSDDFNDSQYTWITVKGTWAETNGNLTNTNKKALVLAPIGACAQCTIDTDIRVTAGTKPAVLGWYQDGSNYVKLSMMESKDKWKLTRISGGKTTAKSKFSGPIVPGTYHHVKMQFDGTQVQVFVDNSATANMTISVSGLNGTPGYSTKKGTVEIDDIQVQ